MSGGVGLEAGKTQAVTAYVLKSTVPLLGDSAPAPRILGTGTLFEHEGRHFIVTAAHILKADPDEPSSADIDLTGIAFPSRQVSAQLATLGPLDVHRPSPPSRVDVVVLELKSDETIQSLKSGWGFLDFGAVGPFPFNARFVLSGYPLEGVTWDGQNVGQRFLTLVTGSLHYVPSVSFPEPSVDRFFHLEEQAQLLDGSSRTIPELQGLSGASLWTYVEPSGFWSPAKAMKVVAVQSSYLRGRWFRCVDWEAVRHIFRQPELGLSNLPW